MSETVSVPMYLKDAQGIMKLSLELGLPVEELLSDMWSAKSESIEFKNPALKLSEETRKVLEDDLGEVPASRAAFFLARVMEGKPFHDAIGATRISSTTPYLWRGRSAMFRDMWLEAKEHGRRKVARARRVTAARK